MYSRLSTVRSLQISWMELSMPIQKAAQPAYQAVFLLRQFHHPDRVVNGLFPLLRRGVLRQAQLRGIAQHIAEGQIIMSVMQMTSLL